MTIKKMMMAAGAIDEPQEIALSSNDWDYTFDGSDDWMVTGNSLGDHTIGGFVETVVHADSGISSLPTLDGDFIISFTLTEKQFLGFGVHAIDEDDIRAQSDRGGLQSMTNSYEWHDDYYSSGTQAAYGGSAEGSFTSPANGSTIVIRRVSGVITLEDDGSVIHTWGTSYSGTMRLSFHASGGTTPDVDNLFFTDTEKVQRDGYYHETASASTNWGDGEPTAKYIGSLFKATRTGNITGIKINITSVTTAFNGHYEIWSSDGTNPVSQIGSDSETINLNSTGEKTFVLNVPIEKGTVFWAIGVDEGTSGNVLVEYLSGAYPNGGYGQNDTLTSLTAHHGNHNKIEAIIDATGEPTPDHDVIFQVQSNDTNGSTSFTDESQTGATVTAVDGAHHDNVQAKFGTTSIYCDGTNDEITIADNIDYSMASGQAFTWEWWMYCNGTPANNTHCAGQGTDATANMAYWSRFNTGGTITVASGNGSSARYITCTTNLSNAWHHIAYIHIAGKSYLCIDGTSEGSPIAHTDIVQNVAYPFTFGGGNNSVSHVDAWFEGMRLSRTARYDPVNGFTPPVARFPSS
jgi:hypothetical protein